jgi:hypothetical protein
MYNSNNENAYENNSVSFVRYDNHPLIRNHAQIVVLNDT